MVKFCLLVGLFAAPVAFAGNLAFADAKILADRDEGSLSAEQQQSLALAQAPAIKSALLSCLPVNGPKSFSFVVVVELDSTGKVRKTWRSDESKLARCFQTVVAQVSLNSPPQSPFYSSFEVDSSAGSTTH